jgi:hypothetical protein
MRFRVLCVAALAVLGSTTGCYQTDAVRPAADLAVVHVILSPADTTLAAGDSVEFRAVLRDSIGAVIPGNIAVSWSISDTTVLALTSTGAQLAAVRARGPGTATLQAIAQGKVGQATIVVH